jgi:exodeoxyribonuclease (lambda-induced)
MSIYNRAMAQLESLESVFGFNPAQVQQKSADWHTMKLGVLSASNADKIVAKRDSEGRQSYMASLISQICSCTLPDELPFKQLEHGNLYEPAARDALSAALGFVEIKELPFMYMDNSLRIGVSPDGVFDETVVEIKAPFNVENYIKFAAFGGNKKAWKWQAQFQLFATKAEQHIFCQYDPRMVLCNNLHYSVTEKSEADQLTLSDAIPQFIADMNEALNSLGVTFGQHWEYLKQQRGMK